MSLLSISALAVTAYEAPPGGWVAKSFGLQVNSEYFTSNANYDSARGSYVRLTRDNTFSSLESKIRGRYNQSGRLSFFGGAGIGYSQAVDAVYEKTNSQVTEAFAGINFLVNRKYLNLVPELMVSAPLNPTSSNQVTPLTSDGVAYVRTGLFLHKPLRHFRLGAFGGVQFPSSGLAPRALYEVTIDARFLQTMTIGAGVDGYEAILSDRDTRESRAAIHSAANAGSSRFFAYQPSLLEVRAWVGFRPDRSFWVRVGAAKTINGKNTAEGQSLLISMVYNSPSFVSQQDNEVVRELSPEMMERSGPRASSEQARKGFKPEVENTEQDLFDSQERDIVPAPIPESNDLNETEKALEKKDQE